jgi:hypothetical protein
MITAQRFFLGLLPARGVIALLKGFHNNKDENGGQQKQRRFVVQSKE